MTDEVMGTGEGKGSPNKARKCYEFGHINNRGGPCGANAIKHMTGCLRHSGKTLQKVKAESAIREAVINWGLDDELVDPGLLMLRLVAQSARRSALYTAEVQRLVAESEAKGGSLERALVGTKFAAVEGGSPVPIGEYTREMVRLEAEERDRAMNFAKIAFAAGLSERQIRLAEQLGTTMAAMVTRAMDAAGVPLEIRRRTMEHITVEMQGFVDGALVAVKA